MKKRLDIGIVLVLLLAVVGSAMAARPSKKWETESGTRKADYIYLEAVRQNMLSNDDASYELISRSYDMNPSDPYVGWERGTALLRLSQGDSAMVEDAVSLMHGYVDRNPSDFYSSVILAHVYDRLRRNKESLGIWETLHRHYPTRPEVTYSYAEQLSQSGDKELRRKALELYDSLEVWEGTNMPLVIQKMRLYLADNDTSSVISEMHRLLDITPNSPESYVFAGNIMQQLSMPDSAMKYFDRAIEIDPSNGYAYYSRANYFRQRNDTVAFDREVFQALKQPDLELPAKLEILQGYIAELYTDTLQQPRIADLFKVLTDQHPHEPDIHKLYMEYLIAVGDYAGAARQADDALSLDPSDEDGWLKLTALYIQADENDKALDAATRGSHYFPENRSFVVFEGMSYLRSEEYEKAAEAFRRGIATTPEGDNGRLSEMYTSLGDVYHAMGQRDSAYVNYNRAVTLDPTNPTALNNTAYYLASTDQELSYALELIRRCLELRPGDTSSLDTYAWVLFKLKRYQEAMDVINTVLEDEDGRSAEVLDHAGDIYFMNQERKEALELWKEALELDPDNELLQRKVRHKTYFYE